MSEAGVAAGIERGTRLSPARLRFAHALAEGLNHADAYRHAYPRARGWSSAAVRVAGSRLAKSANVSLMVAALRAEASAKVALTLQAHLAELARLRDEARGRGQLAAAVAAEIARGRSAGFYEARARVQMQAGLDWRGLLGLPEGA